MLLGRTAAVTDTCAASWSTAAVAVTTGAPFALALLAIPTDAPRARQAATAMPVNRRAEVGESMAEVSFVAVGERQGAPALLGSAHPTSVRASRSVAQPTRPGRGAESVC